VDFEVIHPGILSLRDVESLAQLEPFGAGCPTPVLCMKNVTVDAVTPLSAGRHTRLRVLKNGAPFECIYFSHRAEELGFVRGEAADIAFTPQINEFRSRRSVQLLLLDARAARGDGGDTLG